MKLAKDQIARQFSRAASSYDDVSQLQRKMADQLIACISPDSTGLLVDFGCGTGYAIDQIAKLTTLDFVGVDLAEGMIEHARQRLPHTNLMVGDLEQTSLQSHTADFAFSNAAIQWCESPVAFAEMARVLKPGGFLLASTFGPATLRQWKAAWQSIGDDQQRVHDFESESSLARALTEAGFMKIEITSEMHSLEFDSVVAMFHSIKSLGATNAAVSRATGLLGRKTYSSLFDYFEEQLQSGLISIDFECIFLSASLR